jgi:hypothetical protein
MGNKFPQIIGKPDNHYKEYVTNLWIRNCRTTHICIFYSDAIDENMSVVSEKLMCRFYRLERKNKQREPSQLSKYTFESEIELLSFCTCSFSKSNFTGSLSFGIVYTSKFSKQTSRIIRPLLIGSLLHYYYIFIELLLFQLICRDGLRT